MEAGTEAWVVRVAREAVEALEVQSEKV